MPQRAPMSLVGIEAGLTGIKVLEAGFKRFPGVLQKILIEKGIVEPGADPARLTGERWFPLESWLAVLEVIYKEIGPSAMMEIGARIMENPHFPPGIRDIPAALDALDIVVHRSHRKLGRAMYDVATGEMTEGIGHFRVRHVPGQSKAEVTSDTPYACYADFSIVSGVAHRFDPKAMVVHAEGECRTSGGNACRYVVTW